MKRKVWGLAVLLCLLMSACSGNQAQYETMNTPSNTPSRDSVSMPPAEPAFSLAPSTNEPETKETHLPEPVARIHNGITVKIDPAIELLSIVQYLSGYDDAFGLLTDLEFQYKDEIDACFSGYSGHAAVAFVNDNMEKGFSFHVPPGILLYMGEDFSFDKQGYEKPTWQSRQTLMWNTILKRYVPSMKLPISNPFMKTIMTITPLSLTIQ